MTINFNDLIPFKKNPYTVINNGKSASVKTVIGSEAGFQISEQIHEFKVDGLPGVVVVMSDSAYHDLIKRGAMSGKIYQETPENE